MPRDVTLICGPPCAGKTTLARQLARPGDLVLDLDVVAVELGSARRWRHDPGMLAEAEEVMRSSLRRLARAGDVTAYVIRSLPDPRRRAALARAIGAARTYVLAPPIAVCLRRAQTDHRPPGTATTIRWWYRTYRPHPNDSPCPSQLRRPPMAAAQSRVVACPNNECPNYQVNRTIWAQLVATNFYDWPNLTCTECGAEPKIVTTGSN